MLRKVLHGLLIGLLSAAAALLFSHNGWLEWIENSTWDARVRHLARPSQFTDDIRLILIDQASLDWGEDELSFKWPWPREAYEPILAFCKRSGAKVVAFDMLYTEASAYGVEDDDIFGAAIRAAPPFAGVLWLSRSSGTAETWLDGVPRRRGRFGTMHSPWQGAMQYASFPISQVATNAALLATVNATPDTDAIVRRTVAFQVFDEQPVPSLGLASWMAAHPDETVSPLLERLDVGKSATVPLDSEGNAVLRYRGPSQTHKAVSAAAVIQSEMRLREGGTNSVSLEFLRDKYVFLGVTAPGLMDLKPTPISEVYPGVEIHATFLDNLLAADFLRDVDKRSSWMLVFAYALAAGVFMRFCVTGWQAVILFAMGAAVPAGAGFLAYANGYWLRVADPLASAMFALLGAFIVNYATEGRQKRFIKNAFRQYLSHAVIEKLIRDPNHLKLGGEARELSIYFSDIQGFTSISEGLSPENLTALLNEYLTAMSDIIMEQGGTIDKYEGDAVIAFWNAPLDLADHPVRAVRSALLCQAKLAEMRPLLRQRAGRDLFCRIGLNTGKVVVGNMGSHQRFNYTFLGDAGNLAARLEGVNKQFGTYIMVSDFTRSRIKGDEFRFRELSRVQVVGRKEPVQVYEPMFPEAARERAPVLQTFDRGLQLYYGGKLTEAVPVFEEIAKLDPPAAAYVRRCRMLLEHPPAGLWSGVWEMTEK